MGIGRWTRSVCALLLAGGLAACDPSAGRLRLEVSTTASGPDDAPGDGSCSSAPAGGECTLQAALMEGAAAAGGADVTLPGPGAYEIGLGSISGDIAVLGPAGGGARLVGPPSPGATLVPAGSRLRLVDVNQRSTEVVRLDVEGTVTLERVFASVAIGEDGHVVAVDSVLRTDLEPLVNLGRLVLIRSSLVVLDFQPMHVPHVALEGGPASSTALWGSAIFRPGLVPFGSRLTHGGSATCTGPAPVSYGRSLIELPCGPMEGEGDLVYFQAAVDLDGLTAGGDDFYFMHHSPLVDAIPLGHALCPADSPGVDVYGNPRGVDGDGNGIGGCDLGGVERQPGPPYDPPPG